MMTEKDFANSFGLVVGIGKLKEMPKDLPEKLRKKLKQELPEIPGASNDAGRVVKTLQLLGMKEIRRLTDEAALIDKIHDEMEALTSLAGEAKRVRLVFAYFACHGLLNDSSKLQLVPHNPNFRDSSGGLHCTNPIWATDIVRWLQKIRADKCVLILDVCHSGAQPSFLSNGGHGHPVAVLCACRKHQRAYEVEVGGNSQESTNRTKEANESRKKSNYALMTARMLEAIVGICKNGGEVEVTVNTVFSHVLSAVERDANAHRRRQKPEVFQSGPLSVEMGRPVRDRLADVLNSRVKSGEVEKVYLPAVQRVVRVLQSTLW
jgi:hypothetical protein